MTTSRTSRVSVSSRLVFEMTIFYAVDQRSGDG